MIFNRLLRILPTPKRVEGSNAKILNLKPSPSDSRDSDYQQVALAATQLPPIVSLRSYGFGIKNQGQIGSCGSHAAADLIEIECAIHNPNWKLPLSELWHYWWVRQKEYMNSFPKDSGQYLRDTCKLLKDKGISPETLCPYDYTKYNQKPGIFSDMFAAYWKIKSYHRCFSTTEIKSSLAEKHPVIFGVPVDKAFCNYRSSKPITTYDPKTLAGGHAMIIIGYDDNKKAFEVKNSWGTALGDEGYFWISYSYIDKYLYDAWSIRLK